MNLEHLLINLSNGELKELKKIIDMKLRLTPEYLDNIKKQITIDFSSNNSIRNLFFFI